MKEIMLEANEAETIVFNVAEMAKRFNNLMGTRGKRGKIYSLGMVLTLVILAKLAGEDKPWPIAEWIKLRKDVLVRMFTWHRQRAMSQYDSGDFIESHFIGEIRKGDVGLSVICVDKEVIL